MASDVRFVAVGRLNRIGLLFDWVQRFYNQGLILGHALR